MNTTGLNTSPIGVIDAPEQLELLLPTNVPLQFRLDDRTRRSGLRHVAELRAQIARQATTRTSRPIRKLTQSPSRQIAA